MSKDTEYVLPPSNKQKHKNNNPNHVGFYANIQHDYLVRRLFGLVLVVPAAFMLDTVLIVGLLTSFVIKNPTPTDSNMWLVLIIALVIVTAVYWPYSKWRYANSFMPNFLGSIYYIGGCWSVLLRVVLTLLFSWSIPIIFAPIIGPITRNWAKRNGYILGGPDDFE